MLVPCNTTHGRSHSLGISLREKETGKYRDNKFQHLPAGSFICTWRQGVYWDKVDLWWFIINSLWYVLDDGYLPPRHLATAAHSPRENNHIKPEQNTPEEWITTTTKKPRHQSSPVFCLGLLKAFLPLFHPTSIMNLLWFYNIFFVRSFFWHWEYSGYLLNISVFLVAL